MTDKKVSLTKELLFIEQRKQISTEQKIMAMAELKVGTKCELDHSGDPRKDPDLTAINTLMIKREDSYFPLHVCHICEWSLNQVDWDWHLFVCFKCGSTRWLHITDVIRAYSEQIVGMDSCPNCSLTVDWEAQTKH